MQIKASSYLIRCTPHADEVAWRRKGSEVTPRACPVASEPASCGAAGNPNIQNGSRVRHVEETLKREAESLLLRLVGSITR